MSHTTLRELSKVGAGLVLADIVSVLWLSGAGFFPLSFLGVDWTGDMVPGILVFDIALLILLIHYGWKMRLPVQSPSERMLLKIVGTVFLVVAVGHLLRVTLGLDLILGDFEIPDWVSWLGIILTGYLAYASFHFARHRHH
jgi:hypothetical protein